MGAGVMGISMALMEEPVLDQHDDPHINPLGARGLPITLDKLLV
jgi:hypothetical protein